MKNILIILLLGTLFSCDSDDKKDGSGIVQMEGVSCKDFSGPFKQAIINLIEKQDASFFNLKDSTFIITTVDGCERTLHRYSVKNLKDQKTSVMVDSKEYESINNCGGGAPSSARAEIVTNNYKQTLIKEIQDQKIDLSVTTDRPCSVTFSSSKNHFTQVLYIDNKEYQRVTYDTSNMSHPAELIFRFNKQAYSAKHTPFVLSDYEANSQLKDCVNKVGSQCVDTGTTVRHYIDQN